MIKIELFPNDQQIPYELLKLADPSIEKINQYLESGICFVAKYESIIVGVIVLDQVDNETIEIKNIAVKESKQGIGIGKELLRFAETIALNKKYEKLIIGTGNSSLSQLSLYQKEGFEMKRIIEDFFIDNYEEPIYENGIQCKHMIILEKSIGKE